MNGQMCMQDLRHNETCHRRVTMPKETGSNTQDIAWRVCFDAHKDIDASTLD